MGIVNVEVVLQGASELPRDQFVNTYHFLGGPDDSVTQTAARAFYKLSQLYRTILASYLSPFIDRSVKMVAYDHAAAKPRPIINSAVCTLPAAGSPYALPEEIALCASYYGDRNIPSHRGRVYIGPLGFNAASFASPSRPHTDFIAALVAGVRQLADDIDPGAAAGLVVATPDPGVNPAAWALYSRKLNTVTRILKGWVDDEWDGQDRRRIRATGRTTWVTLH